MAILKPEEYDASYFDGETQPTQHGAGYSNYERWKRHEGVNSLGEYWKDRARGLVDQLQLEGKKTLELGCAKGFLVKDMNEMGVNAFGLDVSAYAISNAEDEKTRLKLFQGDARTALAQFKDNEFDFLFSLRFLECIPETDLPSLMNEIKRISVQHHHVTSKDANQDFYLTKNLVNSYL